MMTSSTDLYRGRLLKWLMMVTMVTLITMIMMYHFMGMKLSMKDG